MCTVKVYWILICSQINDTTTIGKTKYTFFVCVNFKQKLLGSILP